MRALASTVFRWDALDCQRISALVVLASFRLIGHKNLVMFNPPALPKLLDC